MAIPVHKIAGDESAYGFMKNWYWQTHVDTSTHKKIITIWVNQL